jgi:hypothetical protein
MDILITQSPGVLVKGKNGEQDEQEIANDQYIGIYSPLGKQRPAQDEKGVGNEKDNGNRQKSPGGRFSVHAANLRNTGKS